MSFSVCFNVLPRFRITRPDDPARSGVMHFEFRFELRCQP